MVFVYLCCFTGGWLIGYYTHKYSLDDETYYSLDRCRTDFIKQFDNNITPVNSLDDEETELIFTEDYINKN